MIINIGKFEAVITFALIITLSFFFAVKSETKATVASVKNESVLLPIIMYHHITENEKNAGKYTVLKSELISDLEYLRQNGYSTVTVADLIRYTDGEGTLPEKPIMLTFDDGFESFYALAYPLFMQYNMKAVVSVIGSVTEEYSQIDDHNISYSNMNWNEIKELYESGFVEFQNHSYDMHKTGNDSRKGVSKLKNETQNEYEAALINDLTKLQKLFKVNCGYTPTAVAYPYGAYTSTTLDTVKKCGFRCTLLCEERINTITAGNDESLFNLGRYNRESGISTAEFFEKII